MCSSKSDPNGLNCTLSQKLGQGEKLSMALKHTSLFKHSVDSQSYSNKRLVDANKLSLLLNIYLQTSLPLWFTIFMQTIIKSSHL